MKPSNRINREEEKKVIPNVPVSRLLIIVTLAFTLIYGSWWLDFSHVESWVLYVLLFIGEIYHIWQALGYMYTVWPARPIPEKKVTTAYPVDIFITVCGEPRGVLEETVKGATSIEYPHYTVYVLNDGYAAKKSNWKEAEEIAKKYGAEVITREKSGGAKAGNINNALRQTKAPFFVVFDADHIPAKNFLLRVMGYFDDPLMALVQTPQYYRNKNQNYLTLAAWEQQELFFGPICQGKNKNNATFWCGTNAAIRRSALDRVNGIPEDSVTEDFLVSLFFHQHGYRTLYVPEVLAEGLAPQDLKSFISQQYRWARGCLDLLFRHNPLFKKGLTWGQRLHYFYSSSYYLNGLIVLIDAIVPIVVLATGISPVKANTGNFMIYFFPFIFGTLYLLMSSTGFKVTFRAIQLSMSSSFIFFAATIATLFRHDTKFRVTAKTRLQGNFLPYALPNVLYGVVAIVAIIFGAVKENLAPAVITNASWALFNIVFFFSFVQLAYPWRILLHDLRRWGSVVIPVWFRPLVSRNVIREKQVQAQIDD